MHPYEIIRTEILRRINSQAWPTGFSVPHEEELAKEFKVARGTIRRALSTLVDAGLIERRRRAGTRVVGRKSHASTLRIPLVRHEITRAGGSYSYRLLATEPHEGEQPLFGDAPLRHIVAIHYCDGQPYQLEDRLLNLAAVPEAVEQDFSVTSPNEWLVEKVPYSSMRTELHAAAPSQMDERYLGLKPNEPVFVIERQTKLKDVPLTLVRASHPASRFRITTQTEDLS